MTPFIGASSRGTILVPGLPTVPASAGGWESIFREPGKGTFRKPPAPSNSHLLLPEPGAVALSRPDRWGRPFHVERPGRSGGPHGLQDEGGNGDGCEATARAGAVEPPGGRGRG